MFPHTSGSKISQRHQFHQLEPRGVRSFDVKGKQIKGEKKAIKLLETFEYKPEKYTWIKTQYYSLFTNIGNLPGAILSGKFDYADRILQWFIFPRT